MNENDLLIKFDIIRLQKLNYKNKISENTILFTLLHIQIPQKSATPQVVLFCGIYTYDWIEINIESTI